MIHERGIFRAPDTDGRGGSGATDKKNRLILESVATNGEAPPDADDVKKALGKLKPLYRRLGVDKKDSAMIVDRLGNGFDAFEDGDLPVDFLRKGGFHGGDRKTQVRAGEHIITVYQAIEEAVDRLG